jgi:glycogen debranching enzyme
LKELTIIDQHEEITALSKKVYQKFNKEFWDSSQNYAYDFIDGHKANDSIRPNVLIGLSLPFKLFDKAKSEKILEKARKELYTEVGMMTLNKVDLKYIGSYKGSQKERDQAYHNGTIWPFLLGFYLKSELVNNPKDSTKKQQVKNDLITFWKEIRAKKLHYLPEVFAANDLHPDGCLSQAWNYALFLEVYQLLD